MLISHETPIAYLPQSYLWNDYDYCLVHLCDTHPEYLDFYKEAVKKGREVLLDNSIFELGESYDPEKFADRIVDIKPTYFIVPDVLEDAAQTMQNWDDFVANYGHLPGMKIGVVQGKTKQELLDCYRFMSDRADYIAISFDYSYYSITSCGKNKLETYMNGRQDFIAWLNCTGWWRSDKPHHLLGCSLAREFKAYCGLKGLRSVDTSNPIVAALNDERYIRGIGLLNHKPKVKLADQIDAKYDKEKLKLMLQNTQAFREITEGRL